MITQDIIIMGLESIKKNTTNKVDIAIINDAIKEIKKYIELVRDVKRYFSIIKNAMTFDGVVIDEKEQVDFEELQDKLMKVGKEE